MISIMNTYSKYLLLFSLIFVGCVEFDKVEEPVACFIPSKDKAFVGEIITFDNCSQNSTQYRWILTQVTETSEENPSHIFTEEGFYNVYLFAYNENLENYVDYFIEIAPYIDITTNNVSNIDINSVECHGIVEHFNYAHITEYGFCWGINQNPDIEGEHISVGSGSGSFSYKLTNLNSKTTYNVRSYAICDYGITYGNQITFSTN